MTRTISLTILCLTLMMTACRQPESETESESTVTEIDGAKEISVEVMPLKTRNFGYDHVCNGKVSSHQWADLNFTSGEIISDIMKGNGHAVRRGDIIARLDTFRLAAEAEQSRIAFEQTVLEMKDALIGQGYDPDNMTVIPQDVVKLAQLRSGYTAAQSKLNMARRALADATLRAPFDGVVANIEAKKYNRADQSKPFCRVLGADMDVEFNMLESEIGLINIGDKVEILPYSTGDMFSGHITEINPTVNSDGMVRATASVGYGNALCDGQNVKVRVKKDVGNQLTVPKSAVVLRSGKPVVFTLNETGDKAIWNYVTIGLENMTEYTITDGLTEGMTVITDGNVNLAHQSPVKIVKQ